MFFAPRGGVGVEDSKSTPDTRDTREPRDGIDLEDRGGKNESGEQASELVVRTVLDATQFVHELIETQITKATTGDYDAGAGHEVAHDGLILSSLHGDANAKRLFYTLLPATVQRTIFMTTVSDSRNLHRVKWLFGAPPYSFLRHGDAMLLRAAGFSHSRTNMSYDSDRVVPNYSQFGEPHMTDVLGREYRVLMTEASALPSALIGAEAIEGATMLVVRIKKTSRTTRIEKMRTRDGMRSTTFPLIGETLLLKETRLIQRLRGGGGHEATARVMRVHTPHAHASTALVYVNAV